MIIKRKVSIDAKKINRELLIRPSNEEIEDSDAKKMYSTLYCFKKTSNYSINFCEKTCSAAVFHNCLSRLEKGGYVTIKT